MAGLRVRDRDSPISKEGLIFRVYGYDHPKNACVCDLEYAPREIYKSNEKRALRVKNGAKYYKFYFDGGLRFVAENYPQYMVYYKPLKAKLVGLHENQVFKLRKPDEKLSRLMFSEGKDLLLKTLEDLLDNVCSASGLKIKDFGVFGSLLHGFYSVKHSDIDLVVYGRRNLGKLLETLSDLYRDKYSGFRNEFEDWTPEKPPLNWNFKFYSKKEYGWHQKRKLIYGVFDAGSTLKRKVKVEFEPVKEWREIKNNYYEYEEIKGLGWCKALLKVTGDTEAFFMPSIYQVEVLDIDGKFKDLEIKKVVSYVEEFRGQARKGEKAIVKGKIEEIKERREVHHQFTLTYGPEYFNQVFKVIF